MKSLLLTVSITVFFGCFLGKAQTSNSNGPVNFATTSIPTVPANISQFEARGRLITQNGFIGTTTPPAGQQTGEFGTAARWNSMGNLDFNAVTPNLTQTLNGIRTQTNGRGLAWGHSIPAPGQPNAGVLSNPFIEWIGNNNAPNNPPNDIKPGNLEFRYALSPTGAAAARVPIFTMAPAVTTPTPIPSFNYAEANAFVGQKQSGTFGLFGLADTWSATGQLTVPTPVNLTFYGDRQQFQGTTLNNALVKDNITNEIFAVTDYGANTPIGARLSSYKFRSFLDPNVPKYRNIWQSQYKFANMVLGRQDVNLINSSQFYFSLFDGNATTPSNTSINLFSRIGVYVTTDGTDPVNAGSVSSYGAIVGDVSGAPDFVKKIGIVGITNGNYSGGGTPLGNGVSGTLAGLFIGDLSYTGSLTAVSDKKFKTKINAEDNIMQKLMLLEPKNYFFDTEKFKNMALSNKLQHGLISQDVEKVFPELVENTFAPNTSKDAKEDGKIMEYKGLNYMGFIPMLLKGIQELKLENDALKTRLEKLENNATSTLVLNNKTNLPSEIENKAFTLSQNIPNPFTEKTTITYTIPTDTKKAILGIFDLNGKMLLQYNLLQGKNTLTISGNTLSAGMYLYSLIADGQEVVSKRMVLTK